MNWQDASQNIDHLSLSLIVRLIVFPIIISGSRTVQNCQIRDRQSKYVQLFTMSCTYRAFTFPEYLINTTTNTELWWGRHKTRTTKSYAICVQLTEMYRHIQIWSIQHLWWWIKLMDMWHGNLIWGSLSRFLIEFWVWNWKTDKHAKCKLGGKCFSCVTFGNSIRN